MHRGDIKNSFSEGGRHQSRVDTPSLCLLALCLSETYVNSLRLKESTRKTRPASTMLDDYCLASREDEGEEGCEWNVFISASVHSRSTKSAGAKEMVKWKLSRSKNRNTT